jgi:asparagine synthase (glutamine-hydrolysing)
MKKLADDITSFLSFRHPLRDLYFWDYPYSLVYETIDLEFEIAKKRTKELFIRSVKESLGKSKNPAVVISGGLDSVFLAQVMIDCGAEPLLYTAKFKGDDESERAKLAAKELDLEHSTIEILPKDYLEVNNYLKPLIKLKKEPLHPNEIALAKIESKAKGDGCDTIFSGEGADDIFGGYSKIFTFHKTMKFKEEYPSFVDRFLKFYRYFSTLDHWIINPKYITDDSSLLDFSEINLINFGTYFIQRYHTPGLIKRGINAAKFNDLKSEFPYINSKLVAYVNTLPIEYKVFGDVSKLILREIALDNISTEIAYGEKHPFPVPLDNWMKNINEWNLDKNLFTSNDISSFSGWKKWMLINLDTWWKNGQ